MVMHVWGKNEEYDVGYYKLVSTICWRSAMMPVLRRTRIGVAGAGVFKGDPALHKGPKRKPLAQPERQGRLIGEKNVRMRRLPQTGFAEPLPCRCANHHEWAIGKTDAGQFGFLHLQLRCCRV